MMVLKPVLVGADSLLPQRMRDVLNVTYPTMLTATTGDQTARINAHLAAVTPLGIKRLVGSFAVNGTLAIPAGVYVDARGATFTQSGALTTTFTAAAGATLFGGTIVGVGAAEWVNNSTVYAASGVFATGAGVTVQQVTVTNMAGAGVYTATAQDDLRVLDCNFTGVGSPTIPVGTGGQYSGGVVINNNGATNLVVRGGSIGGFAQGIVTGGVTGVFIGGGIEISAAGQHGIYLGAVVSGVISNVRIDGTGLEGIKCQISDASAADGDTFTIGDVVMTGVGSHGVHLANGETVGGTHSTRRVVIHDVSVTHSVAGNGDDVLIEWGNNVTVHDVLGSLGSHGLRILNGTGLNSHDNLFENCTKSGMFLSSVLDSNFTNNRILKPATANTANDESGIFVTGTASATLRFSGNKITDANDNMQYCIYVAAGDLTTMSFVNNVGSGATDYGFRSATTTSTSLWTGNDLNGALGRFFNIPTNVAAIADTTGATVAALETEVNKLKARLREIKVVT